MTIVAAWISAETGVGPAIASGSQVCSGSCADLPTAPPSISSAIAVHQLRLVGIHERLRRQRLEDLLNVQRAEVAATAGTVPIAMKVSPIRG